MGHLVEMINNQLPLIISSSEISLSHVSSQTFALFAHLLKIKLKFREIDNTFDREAAKKGRAIKRGRG